jgi:hypothetical protein
VGGLPPRRRPTPSAADAVAFQLTQRHDVRPKGVMLRTTTSSPPPGVCQ